jgi:hypothetical protein
MVRRTGHKHAGRKCQCLEVLLKIKTPHRWFFTGAAFAKFGMFLSGIVLFWLGRVNSYPLAICTVCLRGCAITCFDPCAALGFLDSRRPGKGARQCF